MYCYYYCLFKGAGCSEFEHVFFQPLAHSTFIKLFQVALTCNRQDVQLSDNNWSILPYAAGVASGLVEEIIKILFQIM